MSKVVVATIATGGVTVAAVGGTYIMQKDNESKIQPTTPPQLLFDSVDKFKEDAKDFECVKKYFKNGDKVLDIKTGDSGATEISKSSSTPADNTFFKTNQPGESDTYESCLLINWKKEIYGDSSDKGKGVFTGAGTFIRGDEGFINFNIAKTSSTEDGKLDLDGIFYLVSKKTDGTGDGELKHKKSANANVKTDNNDLASHLPQLGTIKNYQDKPYWEFTDDTNKLNSMCKTTECNSGTSKNTIIEPKKFIWKKVDPADDTKKLKNWSKDLTGGDKLYSNTDFNLENKIQNFSGEGSLSN